jgi:hypothetical protein
MPTPEDHWRSLGKTVQKRILGKVTFGLRLHTMGIPKAIALELLKARVRELESEENGEADGRG